MIFKCLRELALGSVRRIRLRERKIFGLKITEDKMWEYNYKIYVSRWRRNDNIGVRSTYTYLAKYVYIKMFVNKYVFKVIKTNFYQA